MNVPSKIVNITPKSKSRSIKKILALGALFSIAVLAGVLQYRHHQNSMAQERAYQADKTRFAQVERDMKVAYGAMIAAAGKPDKETESKSCSHTSAKFSEGTLSCSVYYNWRYSEESKESAKEHSVGVIRSLSKNEFFVINKLSPNPSTINFDSNARQSISVYLDGHTQTNCGITYLFGSSMYYQEFNIPIDNLLSDFTFKCEGTPTAPVYTLAE